MNNHPMNILLVEDNPADARLIFELLKDGRGGRYELAHVDRFAKAKERLQRNNVDVVLLDLSLPDSHGLDTITGLNGHTEKLPIIVLTGMDDHALAVTALQAGAQDYLVKGQVDAELLWRSMRYAIERKKAEEAQRESEDKYKSILEEMGQTYHELDAKGNFTFFNNALCRQLGYTRGELAGMNFKDYIPTESWKTVISAYNEVFRTGKPRFMSMTEAVRKDGTRVFGEESIFPLRNKENAIVGFRVIGKDITERRQSEEVVKRTQKNLQLMIDTLPFGIIVINAEDRRIRHANNSALEMAGYKSMEELAGKFCHQTLCPAAEGQCPMLDLGEQVDRSERTLVTRSGKKIPILKTVIPLKIDDENVLLESFVNISRVKEAEQEIEERERLYRTLIETSPDAIGLMDLEGNIIMHNRQALDVFGFDLSEDLRGKNIRDLVAPEHYEDILMKSELVSKTGVIRNMELGSYKKNGQPFYIEVSSSMLLDEDKKPKSVVVVFKDITSRKLAEDELARSYQKLRKTLNDAINTLVKVVEMRDPYTAGHQQRVADLALAIAKKLQLEETRIEELRMAAVIHDIGKIYVPADMLSKPGKLSSLEFEIIKTHAKGGYDIVKGMDFPYVVAQTILQHHERLDGSGYPNGLKDGEIILEARILAVADVVEAMASHRPYRPGLGIDKALDEIQANSRKLYDPDVADACQKLFKEDGFNFEQGTS
jgi:PAS domain S-box-containing protein/putative nucleotidyltransferase with HDIG domain